MKAALLAATLPVVPTGTGVAQSIDVPVSGYGLSIGNSTRLPLINLHW